MVFEGQSAPEVEVDGWIKGSTDLHSGLKLLDFWSMGCPNCIQGVRELNEIHGEGVEVIGVHVPERGFEEDVSKLGKAVRRHGINYHVVHDHNKEFSEAFNNAFMPRRTLIEDGKIVWRESDEGRLLEDVIKMKTGKDVETTRKEFRNELLGYCGRIANISQKTHELPKNLKKDRLYLKGDWSVGQDYIESEGGEIRINTEIGGLDVVADPGKTIRDLKVLTDGRKPRGNEHGEHMREEGFARVRTPGVHRLLESETKKRELLLRPEKGLRLYSLAFH